MIMELTNVVLLTLKMNIKIYLFMGPYITDLPSL